MGSVYRKTVTKAVPEGAEVFTQNGKRFARWTDAKGKTRTVPVTQGKDGADRIVIESAKYIAKYRDGSGVVREASTGCRDKGAAISKMVDLERRAEKVKAGVLTAQDEAIGKHANNTLAAHVADYLQHLRDSGVTVAHVDVRRVHLTRIFSECLWTRTNDMNRLAFERWLGIQAREGKAARTRNIYRAGVVAFANWLVRHGRIVANPFAGIPKANEEADPRRKRRAFTESELTKLLEAAARRPLQDALTNRRGTEAVKLRDSVRDDLIRLGRERALIYKTLVLTGLRRGELASITVGQTDLDSNPPQITLEAAAEKARRGAVIPLRADLAADLSKHLADKLEALRIDSRKRGKAIPIALPGDMRLLAVPDKLTKIFDLDLVAAGIATRETDDSGKPGRVRKRDSRGRSVDVHSLRHTFCTLMSKGGVSLRTAQAAMRHSDPKLTANIYTDPVLLDVAGALDVLPELPLDGGKAAREASAMNGLDAEKGTSQFAPGFAPDAFKRGDFVSILVNQDTNKQDSGASRQTPRIAKKIKGIHRVSFAGEKKEWRARKDSNLRPLAPEASALSN